MNKVLIYLFVTILGLLKMTSTARASTDYIVYAFNMVGVYTGVAQGAINEVSKYTQMINSAKTMVGGYLGDKIAAVQEKVELVQEKVENAQEKMEKVQERIDAAKEKKEALMAKYTELSAKIAEYKEKATKAIQEGQDILNSYKKYKDQVTSAISDVKDMKDNISDKIREAKGLVESKLDTIKEKTGIGGTPEGKQAEEENEISSFEQNTPNNESQPVSETLTTKTSNKAEAIQSAAKFADEVSENKILIESREAASAKDILETTQQEVTLDDVLKATKEPKTEPREAEVRSDLNLEEQLTIVSTKSDAKTTEKELNSIKKGLVKDKEISSAREKFEKTEDLQNREIEKKEDLKNNILTDKKELREMNIAKKKGADE